MQCNNKQGRGSHAVQQFDSAKMSGLLSVPRLAGRVPSSPMGSRNPVQVPLTSSPYPRRKQPQPANGHQQALSTTSTSFVSAGPSTVSFSEEPLSATHSLHTEMSLYGDEEPSSVSLVGTQKAQEEKMSIEVSGRPGKTW